MRGLGRDGAGTAFADGSLTIGEGGGETAVSSFIPSFQAGGEGTWNSSWPLSSARFAD